MTFSQLLNEWFSEPAKRASLLQAVLRASRREFGWDWAGIAESSDGGSRSLWRWAAMSPDVAPFVLTQAGPLVDGLQGRATPLLLPGQETGNGLAWGVNIPRRVGSAEVSPGSRYVLVTSHEPTQPLLDELLPRLAWTLDVGFELSMNSGQQHQRDMLAAMSDAVVVLCERVVHFANDAFLALCGCTLGDVIGADIRAFVHADDWFQFDVSNRQSAFTARFERSDKSVRVVEVSGGGMVSFEGLPSRVFVGRDVTENLLSREQYVRDDRLAAIGSLAVGVAHEVNNPLAYVMLNLEMLQTEVFTPLGQEAVSEALDGVRRIRRIVSELRGFWHGESRAGVSIVDVETAVTAATSLMQNEIRHRATLSRQLERGLCVVAREGHLVQVLVNILLYAIHSIPDNSSGQHTISLGSRSVGDSAAEITISDNGRGFAPEELSRMFDPFGVPRVPGDKTGLGLAITKRMVEELGGHIAVTSDGQRGSTFSVVLPSAPPNEASVDSRRSHPDLLQTPFRVLVVDDEPLIVRAIKRVLSQCSLQTAADGGEAIALLASEQGYDVILCDLMMPRVSGPDLFRHVNERYPSLLPTFVFMTGGAFSDWSRQFLQTAGCPVITKPFDPTELRSCVERTAVSARRRRAAGG